MAAGELRQHRDAVRGLDGARPGHADRRSHDRGGGARALDGPGDAGAGRHERVAVGVHGREHLDLDRDGSDEHARGCGCRAGVAPEHGLGAARRAGGEPVGLERRRLRRRQDRQVLRPRGRKALQQHDRRRQGDAHAGEQLQADRDEGSADRHPEHRHGPDDLHPERPRPGDAPRPGRPPARAGGSRPGQRPC